MFLSHDERPNWETFDKNKDLFEILTELGTNLKVTYKDINQFDNLLAKYLYKYF